MGAHPVKQKWPGWPWAGLGLEIAHNIALRDYSLKILNFKWNQIPQGQIFKQTEAPPHLPPSRSCWKKLLRIQMLAAPTEKSSSAPPLLTWTWAWTCGTFERIRPSPPLLLYNKVWISSRGSSLGSDLQAGSAWRNCWEREDFPLLHNSKRHRPLLAAATAATRSFCPTDDLTIAPKIPIPQISMWPVSQNYQYWAIRQGVAWKAVHLGKDAGKKWGKYGLLPDPGGQRGYWKTILVFWKSIFSESMYNHDRSPKS